MAKVFKATDPGAQRVLRVDRSDLAEFPKEEAIRFDVKAAENGNGITEERDPAALREAVLAEARAEAAKRVQEAYTEGFQRGMAAGREAFEKSVAGAAELLSAAASAMREARAAFLDSLEPQVVELVGLITERVLQREAKTDPDLIHSTVRRALACIADRQRLRLQVHPDDLEALRRQKITLLEDFPGVEELNIETSEEVSRGGCVVESGHMQADARLEVLLNNVLDLLTEGIHERD